MATCKHVEWVDLRSQSDRWCILNPHRLEKLNELLPHPAKQCPRVILFVGSKLKDCALKHLFNVPTAKRKTDRTGINLRLDQDTLTDQTPLLFADIDQQAFTPSIEGDEHASCHVIRKHPLSWKVEDKSQLIDLLIAKLLLPFTDIICVHADDFDGQRQMQDLLTRWITLGSNSHWPHRGAPQIIVTRGDSSADRLEEDTVSHASLSSHAVVKDVWVSATQRQSRSYAKIKTLMWEMLEISRIQNIESRTLFSASHMARLFDHTIEHFSHTISDPLDLIALAHPSQSGADLRFSDHIEHVYKVASCGGVPTDILTTVLASSLTVQALPPKMHRFKGDDLFRRLFKTTLFYTLSKITSDQKASLVLYAEISKKFVTFVDEIVRAEASAPHSHVGRLCDQKKYWSPLRSHLTCLCCICMAPEIVLRCGHALCEHCIRIYGQDCSFQTGRYDTVHLDTCPICGTSVEFSVILKPLTAGARLLSIDGGGVKGIVPIETLKLLQDMLGDTIAVRDLFDLTLGTSAGGLIALKVFLQGASIGDAKTLFTNFSQTVFGTKSTQPKTLISSIGKVLKTLSKDELYESAQLDEILQRQFGYRRLLDSSIQVVSGAKVGVVATTVNSNTSAPARVFASYNGSGVRRRDSGYRLQRDDDLSKEPLIWQAARATSAAPGYFRPAVTNFGAFQDGCMYHNNPVNIALWESKVLWPQLPRPDVVVSLGTGSRPVMASPIVKSPKLSLKDMFVFRVARTVWQSMDGHSAWRDLCNRLDEDTRDDYFRLSLELPYPEPAMDDYTIMPELAQAVRLHGGEQRRSVLLALLVSSIFFELADPPTYSRSRYHCRGVMRCRDSQVVTALRILRPDGLEFFNGDTSLNLFLSEEDICNVCRCYTRRVTLSVPSLDDQLRVCLKWDGLTQTRYISAMPQSPRYYATAQGLDDVFGSVDRGAFRRSVCGVCSEVETMSKRKGVAITPTRAKRTRNTFWE